MSASDPAATPLLRILPAPFTATDSDLLRLQFGADPAGSGALQVPLPLIAGAGAEVWRALGPVRHHHRDDPWVAASAERLVAAWQLAETAEAPLEAAVDRVYREIPQLLAQHGYPHPIKLWHFVADLNVGEGPLERYQRFCVARAPHLGAERLPPAATAIGAPPGSPLTVILLAGRDPVTPIENPRQVPAYRYPARYSPQGPHFSRASLTRDGQLFVSGTAAVVGHESRHPGDVEAQLREIHANLSALVEAAQANAAAPAGLAPVAYQLFLRRAADWPPLRLLWQTLFDSACPLRVLQGDISRRDLLVEAEALYSAA